MPRVVAPPHQAGDDDAPITAAQVALMQRGAEILSSRPPMGGRDEAATRSVGLASHVYPMDPRESGIDHASLRGNKRWAARHIFVVTASSLVLCLLVGSLVLMDVSNEALAPGVEGFLSGGGGSREDALLSGTVLKKSKAVARLAKLAQMWPSDNAPPIPGNARAAAVERGVAKQSLIKPQLALKMVEASPLKSLAKTQAVAIAKIVVMKPAVKMVKTAEPVLAQVVTAATPANAQKPVVSKPEVAAKKASVKLAAAKKVAAAKKMSAVKPSASTAAAPVAAAHTHSKIQQQFPQQQQYEYTQQKQQPTEQPYAYQQQQPYVYQPPQYMAQPGYAPPQQQLYVQPGQQAYMYPAQQMAYAAAPYPTYQQPAQYAQQMVHQQQPRVAYPPQQQMPQQQVAPQQILEYAPQYAQEPPQYAPQPRPQQLAYPAQGEPQQAQAPPQQLEPLQPAQPQAAQPAMTAPVPMVVRAEPKQALSLKPLAMVRTSGLPRVESIAQLQAQVQKQSLGQRLAGSLPPAVLKQQQVAQQQATAAGASRMLVDGSAADTASLEAQAGHQASKQLLKGLGSDTPQQLSLRQQMEQKMLSKFNQAVAPPAPSYSGYGAYPQMQQAPQMPNQQLLAGAFGANSVQPNSLHQNKVQGNPHIARMMAMG